MEPHLSDILSHAISHERKIFPKETEYFTIFNKETRTQEFGWQPLNRGSEIT